MASMALEDAMVLAKMLREGGTAPVEQVYMQFERQRRPRTDKVIAFGRRLGQRKERKSRLAYWFEQQMIRIFAPPHEQEAGLAPGL
jgi:2-polyprenyl-6-methoxyphenol hydroxylase-like FAD-dependent oxidoreductase